MANLPIPKFGEYGIYNDGFSPSFIMISMGWMVGALYALLNDINGHTGLSQVFVVVSMSLMDDDNINDTLTWFLTSIHYRINRID